MIEEMPIEVKLKTYAIAKQQVKKLEEEMEALKPEIMEYMASQKVEKLPTNLGTFTIGTRSTWKYSPKVAKLQEEEKATGIAEQVVSHSLIYNAPKGEVEE